MHGGLLCWRDPEVVFVLDGDLARDVLATEGFIGWEPVSGVLVEFVLVGGTIDGEEIERILTEGVAGVGVELEGAGGPGVAKGDDVVDLDSFGSVLTAFEIDDLASIKVVESAGLDLATFKFDVSEIAVQDNFAHAAATLVKAPLVIELFAVVFLRSVFRLDGEVFENVDSLEGVGDGLLGFEGDVRWLFDVVASEGGKLPGAGIKEKIDAKSSYQEQNHKEAPDAIGDFLLRHN